MQISRAILVLGLEWACLLGGMVAGMAVERCVRTEDIRIILAGVAALALVAGGTAGRLALADAHECNVGSLLFVLTAALVNLMMVRDGTDGHLAGGILCAAAAAAVFHLAATRAGPRLVATAAVRSDRSPSPPA
ncbi:MAG: hypothetical protein ACRYGC_12645 [Janthinobacterium lividum]